MSGILYICGLPIGNIGDISLRVLKKLYDVDLVVAEDTKSAGLLLSQYKLKKNFISYHDFSKDNKLKNIIAKLRSGKSIALISDAGMPTISDPGYELVKEAAAQKIEIACLPGPTALTTALALSGLPTDRFCFEGFLKNKTTQRKKRLEQLKNEERTLIFYEAPHRIKESLQDMKDILGDRECFVGRELTKKFEEHLRGKLSEVIKKLKTVKGEFVVVVEGDQKKSSDSMPSEITSLISALKEKKLSNKDITEIISTNYKIEKNKIKKLILNP